MTPGYSCQLQGSQPTVADSGHEQSSSVLFTTMPLPNMGSHPQCKQILLQQHPCLSPPQEGSAGTSPRAALAKFTDPCSPGSVLGCKSRSSSRLGDLLQDQSQRRRHRVWGADRGFPSPSPIPLRLASCEQSPAAVTGWRQWERCTQSPEIPCFSGRGGN